LKCPDTLDDTNAEEIQQKLDRELIPDLDRIQQDIEEAVEVLKKARMRSMGMKEWHPAVGGSNRSPSGRHSRAEKGEARRHHRASTGPF
jgi:hypothetical protein